VAPLPSQLIDDFVRFCGGDPGTYEGVVPPALFPQWSMPLMAKTLLGLPYAFPRIVNAGASVQVSAPLPRGEPLDVEARLLGIDDNDRRVLFTYEAVTGTARSPRALVASIQAVIVRARPAKRVRRGSPTRRGGGKAKALQHIIPYRAACLRTHAFRSNAGQTFALLTGDVNPVHWLPPYARAFGYARPILHGFATFAYAFETLVSALCQGDASRLRDASLRFTRPLVLPAAANVYVHEGQKVYVGLAPGAPAVAVGSFTAAGRSALAPADDSAEPADRNRGVGETAGAR
jgi:hypothetical protein